MWMRDKIRIRQLSGSQQWAGACLRVFSSGGSIVQPRTSTSFLHVEPHPALHHVVLTDSRYVLVATWPGREDLAWNLHPSLLLHLHAVHLREHAKDFRHSASVWSVMTLFTCRRQRSHEGRGRVAKLFGSGLKPRNLRYSGSAEGCTIARNNNNNNNNNFVPAASC